jgi:hypothetical protein
MRDLSARLLPEVSSLPSPSTALKGAIMMTAAGNVYFCDGTNWHQLNLGRWAYPKRSSAPKIVGDVSGAALTTQALTASRQYFIPLVVPRPVALTGLRISVTTASSGAANLGIYGNTVVSGDDAPGNLLASIASTLDTGSTGNKDGTITGGYTLLPGVLYWASLIGSAAATLRAMATTSIQAALGRIANSANGVSYLYASGSGSTLPDPAPTSLTEASGASTPAIYLLE